MSTARNSARFAAAFECIFHRVVGLNHHPKLLLRQLVPAQALHIFQRIQQFKHLVSVRKRPRIGAQQKLQRANRATLAPTVTKNVEC